MRNIFRKLTLEERIDKIIKEGNSEVLKRLLLTCTEYNVGDEKFVEILNIILTTMLDHSTSNWVFSLFRECITNTSWFRKVKIDILNDRCLHYMRNTTRMDKRIDTIEYILHIMDYSKFSEYDMSRLLSNLQFCYNKIHIVTKTIYENMSVNDNTCGWFVKYMNVYYMYNNVLSSSEDGDYLTDCLESCDPKNKYTITNVKTIEKMVRFEENYWDNFCEYYNNPKNSKRMNINDLIIIDKHFNKVDLTIAYNSTFNLEETHLYILKFMGKYLPNNVHIIITEIFKSDKDIISKLHLFGNVSHSFRVEGLDLMKTLAVEKGLNDVVIYLYYIEKSLEK